MTVLRPAKFSLPAPPARLSTGQPDCLRHRPRAIESFLQKAYNTTIKVKATLQLTKQQIALQKAAGKKGIQLIFFKPSKPIAQTEFVNQRDNGTRVYVNSDSDVAALAVSREVRGAAAETVQVADEVRQTGDGAVEGIVNESKSGYNPNNRITQSSKRLQYMGKTPNKSSRTGREVIERMNVEGKIQNYHNEIQFLDGKGVWRSIIEADMAHIIDAVTWWNEIGRKYGPKSKEVREWMLDPNNYYLEYYRINRSLGASSKETYLPPEND